MENKDIRILIVDDEPDIIEILQYNLEKEGYTAITAENGKEAIEKAKAHTPHLIILDIMMPDMDGIEAARQIRDPQSAVRNPSIPIIAMSAFTTYDEQQKSLKAGMNTFLSKPITPQRLSQQIQNLAALRGTELRDNRESDRSDASK